jgi:hypothetical protein
MSKTEKQYQERSEFRPGRNRQVALLVIVTESGLRTPLTKTVARQHRSTRFNLILEHPEQVWSKTLRKSQATTKTTIYMP